MVGHKSLQKMTQERMTKDGYIYDPLKKYYTLAKEGMAIMNWFKANKAVLGSVATAIVSGLLVAFPQYSWVIGVLGTIVSGVGVYQIPNIDKDKKDDGLSFFKDKS